MLLLSFLIARCFATVNPINLTIGIDITNKDSLSYLGKLEQHYQQFQAKGLTLNILNHILPCYTCQKRHNYTKPEPNCYGGGRYCQFSSYANGQLLLTEIIRQKCIFTNDIFIFLNYINLFQQDCLENPHYTYCSQHILQNILNYDVEELDQCINASFLGEGDQALLENFILSQEMKQQYNQSTLTVYLNHQDISHLEFADMIIHICQKLKNDPPDYCNIHSLLVQNTSIQLQDEIYFYLFIIFLLLLIWISIRVLKKVDQKVLQKGSNPIEETIGIIQEENIQ
ncbi:unnamed protein product [Paramecium sonneborni]|uniref:Vacuolar sorting receptor thioredoxin-like domain-containing protein n=1 Tax=Paramecium sonneborni TaxID=65129 RepID=A0A8S1QP74_9CILI|nr:unnamed protein product [Paramecium sonneborni]